MHKESLVALIFLTLSSECWDYRHASPPSVSVMLGIELRVLFMRGKCFTSWAILLASFKLWDFFMEGLYIQGIEDAINKPSVRWL